MKHKYQLTGMTCSGCVATVVDVLSAIDGVQRVDVSLTKSEAEIHMAKHQPINTFTAALSSKYEISEKELHKADKITNEISEKSKLQQLKSLLLDFAT